MADQDMGKKVEKASGLLTNGEIAAFCAQIAMIMKAGINAGDGVSIMRQDMESQQGKDMLGLIQTELEDGQSFHTALAKTGRFPQYLLDMTEVGERSGKLDDVMDSLCNYYEREEAVAKNIRSAVTYPFIMVTMMLLVIIVLIVKVLPVFDQVFAQLGTQITGFSRAMMNLGQNVAQYAIAVVGLLVVLVAAFLFIRGTSAGKKLGYKMKTSFFATRKLVAKIAAGRFASTMSLMLSSGLDVDQALDMSYRIVDNSGTRAQINNCKELMKRGDSFSDALVKSEIFTGVDARMVAVGFKTGSVDTVMERIAETCDEQVNAQISGILSVLEPTLVAVLSIVMGLILVSVMLPLLGIMTSIA